MRTVVLVAAFAAILCGNAFAAEIPRTSHLNAELSKRLRCMRDVMFTEASVENDYAKRMVGWVVMRRLEEGRPEWRGDVCSVIYRKGQFDGMRHAVVLSDRHPMMRHIARLAAQVLLHYWEPKTEHRDAIAFRLLNGKPPRKDWFATLVPIKGTDSRHTFYKLPDKLTIARR